jgi:hypothetical protein
VSPFLGDGSFLFLEMEVFLEVRVREVLRDGETRHSPWRRCAGVRVVPAVLGVEICPGDESYVCDRPARRLDESNKQQVSADVGGDGLRRGTKGSGRPIRG